MASSMTTPISQIPANPSNQPGVLSDHDDPFVNDVISEMENLNKPVNKQSPPQQYQNVQQAQPPQQYQNVQQAQPQQQYQNVQQSQTLPQQYYQSQLSSQIKNNQENKYKFVDVELIKRAVFVSLCAGIMFYPDNLNILYDKIPMIKLDSYDKLIRVLLLSILLYVLMFTIKI